MERFPDFSGDVAGWVRDAVRAQETNVSEADNYKNTYQKGRRTSRVPTGNADVIAGDRKWDVTNDGTYEYTLVEVSTNVFKWDRRTMDVAW